MPLPAILAGIGGLLAKAGPVLAKALPSVIGMMGNMGGSNGSASGQGDSVIGNTFQKPTQISVNSPTAGLHNVSYGQIISDMLKKRRGF